MIITGYYNIQMTNGSNLMVNGSKEVMNVKTFSLFRLHPAKPNRDPLVGIKCLKLLAEVSKQ